MRIQATALVVLALSWAQQAHAFTIASKCIRNFRKVPVTSPSIIPKNTQHPRCRQPSSSTALSLLLNVPDDFFTITFPMLGIILSFSKSFARIRMEENAWEQRLAEGRAERLRRDPTLTELDLRRQEAELEWSAYGKPRMQEEQQQMQRESKYSSRGQRVKVKNRVVDDLDDTDMTRRDYRMTDQEIQAFELEYGVDYDPYYDDPYSEDELPEGKYTVDRKYGDRIYDNGEIFYKDAQSKLFYRQGAKPRGSSFWG